MSRSIRPVSFDDTLQPLVSPVSDDNDTHHETLNLRNRNYHSDSGIVVSEPQTHNRLSTINSLRATDRRYAMLPTTLNRKMSDQLPRKMPRRVSNKIQNLKNGSNQATR